ncbi:MAG: hypothetical protein GF401_13215 [Chitinivibrionales bacterium]|nr:hypothetical protein [Chitinivibrionales bacterium]
MKFPGQGSSMKNAGIVLLYMVITHGVFGGTAVNRSYSSSILLRDISYTVILPDDYEQQVESGKQYPVVYLLHCATCSKDDWTNGAEVQNYIDSAEFIAVAPDDGSGRDSWWLDSPINDNWNYSTWLAEEFKPLIDSLYATGSSRELNGLCGHSMGGFGALHNLIRHPDIFSVAFSIKGCVDIMPYNGKYFLNTVLGDQSTNDNEWKAVTPVDNICALKNRNVHIGFYSGPNDKFHEVNAALHDTLEGCDIEHLYYTNGEDHYTVPPSSMEDVMMFFDSVFTVSSSVKNPEKKERTGLFLPLQEKYGVPVIYNTRGRRIKTSQMSHCAFGKGIYFISSDSHIPNKAYLHID